MKPGCGKVYIVGAGPGDPGLITLKALEKLKQADVVVYDRLINDDLLSYCKNDCEKIFVGKESGYHHIEQECIIDILINKSKLGFNVVRLKGGNPFIFGRGSEEAIALKNAQVDFEIIPGITAGLSAPIYSGIPITQRGLITQCVLITAHESPDKNETQVEWEKLARLKNTSLIIYMGASRIEKICRELIKHGMDPSMPVAVIENGTLPKQRTITERLDKIAEEFRIQNFHAPVIIMISPTVSLREEISWFEKKPLFNKRIAIAGNRDQSRELYNMLYDLGGEVLLMPIDITQTEDIWESPSCAKVQIEGNDLLNLKNKDSYGSLYNEFSECGISVSIPEEFKIGRDEMETQLINDIKKNGADVFIFTSSMSVDNFFNLLGNETATKLIEHSICLAVDPPTISALINKNIINVKATEDNTVKGIYDLVCNLYIRKDI